MNAKAGPRGEFLRQKEQHRMSFGLGVKVAWKSPLGLRCYLLRVLRPTAATHDRKRGVGLSELNSCTAHSAGAGNNWRLRQKNSRQAKESEISRMGFDFMRSKLGIGSYLRLHWEEGGLNTMEIVSKKGFTR